jgi:hypothetical protein
VKISGKETFDKNKKDNYLRAVKGRKHEEKKKRICMYIHTVRASNEEKVKLCLQMKRELAAERKIHVQRLVELIFQVQEVALVRYMY